MSAVSQSYPNYLGGLNEQPDELKKPGQLVEALNVIPDPIIGLTRRPGFKKVTNLSGIDPAGTWFELDLDGKHHFGCVNLDGAVNVFDEDGNTKTVRYLNRPIGAHKKYTFDGTDFTLFDDEGVEIAKYETRTEPIDYFKHVSNKPLKYCVSKKNIVFTNPTIKPELNTSIAPTSSQERTYYSFITLKLIDKANYNYSFKRFYGNLDGSDNLITYKAIKDISLEDAIDLDSDYDNDMDEPWKGEVRTVKLSPNDSKADEKEDAEIKVTFSTRREDIKSNDGDGYRTEFRHSWEIEIINPGKGFKTGEIRETIDGIGDGPDVELVFKITKTEKITSVDFDLITINENSNDAESILKDLAAGFKAKGINKVVIVGNGIYLENNIPFSVSTAEVAVADVMNSQRLQNEDDEYIDKVPIVRVNTVADLPAECYHGFIVEVVNSLDNKNNYYLQYVSESTQDPKDLQGNVLVDIKSDGFWEEIAKPYEKVNPKNGTLPHMITAVPYSERGEFAFVVSKMGYPERTAGTKKDNPSFFVDESPITAVNYYKNRLFFLTEIGTVVSSRAGEIGNLFLNSAITVSLIDPIDVVANSNKSVPIHDSIVINNGMVLFGDSEQYTITTSNDILSSETVNVTKVANYTFDRRSSPIYLGTNLGFTSGGMTRFYEMTNIYDRGPVDMNERSQQISTSLASLGGYNVPVSSREQSQVILYKKYEGINSRSRTMFLYRFRQESSQESSQTSWVKWKVDKPVTYVSMPKNNMFVVVSDGIVCKLYRMTSASLDGLPATGAAPPKRFLFTDGYTDNEAGTEFETKIIFPTIYAQSKGAKPVSDVTANLTIHRVKMSTSEVGAYNLKIERKGYDDYDLLVEQTPADEYNSNFPPLYGEKIETVPIYTRNKNLKLTISTKFDAPFTLRSMTWEGDWNRPYYKSV